MSAKHTFALAPDVKDVLDRSTIGATTLVLPEGTLDRKLYEDVNKVLAAHGGVWKRGPKHHVFPVGGIAKLMAAMGTGEVKREKVIRQAFYTPDTVANALVAFSELQNMKAPMVLEPSCGDGALIRAILRANPTAGVAAFEIDPAAAHGVQLAEGQSGKHVVVTNKDFLTAEVACLFTHVVVNPPYQRGQAKKHIEHAFEFLRPGGILTAIVPANFAVFDLEVEISKISSRDIPAGAFKESGTMIATKMIRLVKP